MRKMTALEFLMAAFLAAGGPGAEPSAPGAKPPEPPPPEWLSASGASASEEAASPAAAQAWARLLDAEGNYAAASRAWEGLFRVWPDAAEAPRAALAAAEAACDAGNLARADALLAEARARWGHLDPVALHCDRIDVSIAEVRLRAASRSEVGPGQARSQARRALRSLQALLERDKVGPWSDRAALGAARAELILARHRRGLGPLFVNHRARGVAALEKFLKDYPRSELVPQARKELAAERASWSRGRSPERADLAGAREEIEWARQQAGAQEGIERVYRDIAAREAELMIEEARLYRRLRQRRAAETVLRALLGRYGRTPAAARAAELLEELSR